MNRQYSICLISLLLVIFLSAQAAYSQSAENYHSLGKDSKLTISASPSELSAGGITHVAIIIENNEKYDVKLMRVELVSPWQIVKTLDSPLIIKPNSSSILAFDVPIQRTVEPDSYTLIVSVTDSNEITKTSSATLKIKEFAPLKLEYSWILALLTAYYIPAQIIERILEILRLVKPSGTETKSIIFTKKIDEKYVQEIKEIPTKIYRKFDEIYQTISNLEDQLAFKKRIKAKIEESIENDTLRTGKLPEKTDTKYQTKELLDIEISDMTTDLSKAKKTQSFLVWTIGLAMSFVPGGAFAYYGLGLLQMIDHSIEIKVIDVIFNSLIIASGTKPIHDIIKRIRGD